MDKQIKSPRAMTEILLYMNWRRANILISFVVRLLYYAIEYVTIHLDWGWIWWCWQYIPQFHRSLRKYNESKFVVNCEKSQVLNCRATNSQYVMWKIFSKMRTKSKYWQTHRQFRLGIKTIFISIVDKKNSFHHFVARGSVFTEWIICFTDMKLYTNVRFTHWTWWCKKKSVGSLFFIHESEYFTIVKKPHSNCA